MTDNSETRLQLAVSAVEGAAAELHIVVAHQLYNRSQLRALKSVMERICTGTTSPRSLTVVLDTRGCTKAVERAGRRACGKATIMYSNIMEPLGCVVKALAGVDLHQNSSIAYVHDALPEMTFVEDIIHALVAAPRTPLFTTAPAESRSFVARALALAAFCDDITAGVALHHSADLLLHCWVESNTHALYDPICGMVKRDGVLIMSHLRNTMPVVSLDDERTLSSVCAKTGLGVEESARPSALCVVAKCRLQIGRAAAAFYRCRDDLGEEECVSDIVYSRRHGMVEFVRRLRSGTKLNSTILVPAVLAELGVDHSAKALGIDGSLNFLYRKEILRAYPQLPEHLRCVASRLTNKAVGMESHPPRRR